MGVSEWGLTFPPGKSNCGYSCMILHVQFNCTYSCFILQKLGRHLFSGLEKFNYLQPQAINYLRQIENTRIFLLSLIKPLTLLHIKYLSSPLPSFNVVLKTTGFVQYGRASWPKQHCTYGDGKGGGGNLYMSLGVQLWHWYWKTGRSIARVLSVVVACPV